MTGKSVSYQVLHDFTLVEGEEALDMFKFSAMNLPDLTEELSLKYQVLSDTTAMIGVVIQEECVPTKDNDCELEELETIQFGRGVVKTEEPEV